MEHILGTPAGIEGRAKIIWGDNQDTVASYLAEQGLGQEEINYIIEASMIERTAEIRDAGKALVLRAVICFLVGVAGLFFFPGFSIVLIIYSLVVGIIGTIRFTSGMANGDVGKMTGLFG